MKILFFVLVSVFAAGFIMPADAAEKSTVNKDCKIEDGRTVCTLPNPLAGNVKDVPNLIGNSIRGALGIIGGLALVMMVWGGFLWLTSAGNEDRVKQGTQTMLWAVIGVILVFSSYIILSTFTNYLTGAAQ